MDSKSWVDVKEPSENKKMKQLAIIVPCYNEEEILQTSASELLGILHRMIANKTISIESAIYFVDDGSRDKTWEIIESLTKLHNNIHGIKLSRNCGHQNAIMAGMLSVSSDMIITIDADLQDDTNAIESMVKHHEAGADIVYGIRSERGSDSFFKRESAQWYYKLLAKMGVNVVFNHADYRLLSRKALDALKKYNEVNLFLRGIIPQLGFTCAYVEYARKPRKAGESKYPLRKMLSLAWNGITSFSTLPLRMMFYIGIILALLSFLAGVIAIAVKLFTDSTIPGWTSVIVPMFFLGGLQLISIGIMGEYIGKIYMETKSRPRFHIDKAL